MAKLSSRAMKALLVVSVIAPASILASLVLTRFLQPRMPISETITLEVVRWEFVRQDHSADIYDEVEALYGNDEVTANPRVNIWNYFDRPHDGNYDDSLSITVATNLTIAGQYGFVDDIYVVLNKDQLSLIDWIGTTLHFENLSLIERVEGYESSTKAYVKLAATNHSNSVYFSSRINWSLLTPNSQTHQMEIVYEFTYFNGTAYKKIIQPFQLKIVGK